MKYKSSKTLKKDLMEKIAHEFPSIRDVWEWISQTTTAADAKKGELTLITLCDPWHSAARKSRTVG